MERKAEGVGPGPRESVVNVDLRGNGAKEVTEELQANLAQRVTLAVTVHRVYRGTRDLKDLRGRMDFQDPKDLRDLRGRTGYRVTRGNVANRVSKARLDPLAHQESLALRVLPVTVDPWGSVGILAHRVLQVNKASQGLRGRKGLREILVRLVLPENLVQLESGDSQGHEDYLALWVLLD